MKKNAKTIINTNPGLDLERVADDEPHGLISGDVREQLLVDAVHRHKRHLGNGGILDDFLQRKNGIIKVRIQLIKIYNLSSAINKHAF